MIAVRPVGDQAFSLDLSAGAAGETTGARVLALTERLVASPLAGVTDVVPGYDSVLVTYDPLLVTPATVSGWLSGQLSSAVASFAGREVEIPVLYDAGVAPDLEPLAAEKEMTSEALAALHAAGDYRCALLGFRPGFPFLTGLDPRLHAGRLTTPRTRVPAGSVGIGGRQTGVYPVDSPGGWRLIGRTPLRLFDPARAEPFLVRAGDRVRFAPIDRATYQRLGGT